MNEMIQKDNREAMAALFHLDPEQLMAMVQGMQGQGALPVQPEEPESPVEYYESEEYEKIRKKVAAEYEENVIEVSELKSGKFEGFKQGDVSDVTSEKDFKQALLYEKLYSSSIPEELRETMKYDIMQIAKKIGKRDLAAYFKNRCILKEKKIEEEKEKEKKQEALKNMLCEKKTEFTKLPGYCTGNKFIGSEWTAVDDGVYCIEDNGKTVKRGIACGRPVLVNRLLEPVDDTSGAERVELVFLSEKGWKTRIYDRRTLLDANKAIALADDGVAINSDRAKAFTNFMTSMLEESAKRDALETIKSASKLAMFKDGKILLPYTDELFVFEREQSFPRLVEALRPHGERDAWYAKFKELRATKQTFFGFAIASVLAGPILGMLDMDGFVCNVYGMSGGGKSVADDIAATIWGSYKAAAGFVYSAVNTSTMLEVALDTMNCLPLVIDDYNGLEARQKEKFNQTIMQIANGRGKGRATKDLSLRRTMSWQTNCLINSEQPIREKGTTSGIPNRVLACQAPDEFPWKNPDGSLRAEELMDFFGQNYGHAGIEYVRKLNELGKVKILEIKAGKEKEIRAKIEEKKVKKTERQIAALAVLLTADEIAARYLFEDGNRIDLEDAIGFMEDAGAVNQNERFYEIVIDLLSRNSGKFLGWTPAGDIRGEVWGTYDDKDDCVAILPSVFGEWAAAYEVSVTMFCNYMKSTGRLVADSGRTTKKIAFCGQRPRMVCIKLPRDEGKPEAELTGADGGTQQEMVLDEDIPFN